MMILTSFNFCSYSNCVAILVLIYIYSIPMEPLVLHILPVYLSQVGPGAGEREGGGEGGREGGREGGGEGEGGREGGGKRRQR